MTLARHASATSSTAVIHGSTDSAQEEIVVYFHHQVESVTRVTLDGSSKLLPVFWCPLDQDIWWKFGELDTEGEVDMLGKFWEDGGWRATSKNREVTHSPRASLGESRVMAITDVARRGDELMVCVKVQVTKHVPWMEVEQRPFLAAMVEEYFESHGFGDLLKEGPHNI